jgi:HEAT repeat protein
MKYNNVSIISEGKCASKQRVHVYGLSIILFFITVLCGCNTVENDIAILKSGKGYERCNAASQLGNSGDHRAVEPLIAVLKDEDYVLRMDAAEALGKIGDTRAVEPLIAVMKDKDYDVRESAAEALGKIGDSRAIEPLLAAMKDKHDGVQNSAAEALAKIGDSRAISALLVGLKSTGLSGKSYRFELLVKIGTPALEPLITTLKDKDENVREYAAQALGELGDARAVEPLIITLKDKDKNVREYAAKALGKIGDSRAVEPLIAAMKDKDYSVRGNATEALGKIGDSRAVEPLIAVMKDKDYDFRESAAEALGKIGDSRAVAPLIATLRDDNRKVRNSAIDALSKFRIDKMHPAQQALYYVSTNNSDAAAKIGQPAVETLIAATNDIFGDVRKSSFEALGKIGTEKLQPALQAKYYVYTGNSDKASRIGQIAVEPLIDTLKDNYMPVRKYAVDALVKIGQPTVDPLITTLKDKDENVREYAAEALGKIGDAHAVEPLIIAMRDNNRSVRVSSIEALGKIGDARAIEPLIAALRDNDRLVRNSAINSLVKIGKQAVNPLLITCHDKDSFVRQAAVEALGKIGDVRAISYLIELLSDDALGVRCEASEALSYIGQPSVELLREYLLANPTDSWTRIALTLCGHQESANIVLQNLKQGTYSADMRCLLLGWFGEKELLPQLEHLPFGSELRTSAKNQQLDESDWNEAIGNTVYDSSRVEFTLSALSIVPKNSNRQYQVEDLCLRYIRHGDIRIIPPLMRLLNMYGTKQLAEDYYNCGQSDLQNVASSWGSAHGYSITRGSGSNRASWGSNRN